jgi:hypothetical protein
LVKFRKLFSSSDSWSPGMGFFPIGTKKILFGQERIYVYSFINFCISKSYKNCDLLSNLNPTRHQGHIRWYSGPYIEHWTMYNFIAKLTKGQPFYFFRNLIEFSIPVVYMENLL